MTVSRILRNYPNHNPETRERVLKVAEEIGYKRNPLVAALMAQVRGRKATPFRPSIALIRCVSEDQPNHAFANYLRQGLIDEATFNGFDTEVFNINAYVTFERMMKVMEARGFHCLVMEPMLHSIDGLPVNLDKFATINTTSSTTTPPAFDHVTVDQHSVMSLAILKLKSKGYNRYGFVTEGQAELLMQNRRIATYLLSQMDLRKDQKIPVHFRNGNDAKSLNQLKLWMDKYKPEVVISSRPDTLETLNLLGYQAPKDFGFICLNLHEPNESMAGINPNWYNVGAIAAKQVIQLLIENNLGPPTQPKITFLQPSWYDGDTLPQRTIPSFDVA